MKTIHKLVVLAIMAIITFSFSSTSAAMSSGDPMLVATQQSVNENSMVQFANDPCAAKEDSNAQGDALLPLNRWGGVSSFHTRLSTGAIGTGNLAERIQKQGVASMFLSAGNIMWQVSADMVTFADRFCISNTAFTAVDKMAGTLGNALFSSDDSRGNPRPSVVGIAVFASLAVALFAVARGQDGKKKVTSMLISVGVLAVMVAGASKTTDAKFGFGSPGYLASSMNSIVSTVASVPAQALNDSVKQIQVSGNGDGATDQHCDAYTSKLEDLYRSEYSTVAAGAQPGGPSAQGTLELKGMAIVPLSLNSMWKSTGLRVFTEAQFGARNPYGARVNCRYLESVSGIPVQYAAKAGSNVKTFGQWDITNMISNGGQFSLNWNAISPSSAPFRLYDDKRTDAAMVGWAACNVKGGKVTVDPSWGQKEEKDRPNKRHEMTDKYCAEFFGTNQNGAEPASYANPSDASTNFGRFNPFDYEDDGKNIGGSSEQSDFVNNWHGTQNTAAVGTVMLYSVVSLVIVIVFGILALAIIVAKIGLLMMTLLMVVIVVASILPGDASTNRIAQVFKQYLGMAFLAFGASLMIAMVAIITETLYGLGSSLGNNSAISIVWSGISPAVAIFMLHYLFTKVFKAPSPFKPTAAMGFAQAAAGGAVGGAVGGGMVSRQMNRMRYAAERDFMDSLPGRRRGRGGAAMRRGGDQREERTDGFGSGGSGGMGGSGGPGGTGGGLSGYDGTLSEARKGLVEGADDSKIVGEDLYAHRKSGTASAKQIRAEERRHADLASDWANSQKWDRREKAVKSAGASITAGAGAAWAASGGKDAWDKAGQQVSRTRSYTTADGKIGSKDRSKAAIGLSTAGVMAKSMPGAIGSGAKSAWSGTKSDVRSAASGVRSGSVAAWNGLKASPSAIKSGAKAAVKATPGAALKAAKAAPGAIFNGVKASDKAIRSGARGTGRFISDHKTAITMAGLGMATVATAGIAAPLAAGYAAKKGVGAVKKQVRGEGSSTRRVQQMRDYNAHLADKARAEVETRNEQARLEAARKNSDAAHVAQQKEAGQDQLFEEPTPAGTNEQPEPAMAGAPAPAKSRPLGSRTSGSPLKPSRPDKTGDSDNPFPKK